MAERIGFRLTANGTFRVPYGKADTRRGENMRVVVLACGVAMTAVVAQAEEDTVSPTTTPSQERVPAASNG